MKHHRVVMPCLIVLSVFILVGSAWGWPDLEWSKRFDGPGHGADVPVAVAVDASGDVVVAGTMARTGDRTGFAVRKYGAHGDFLWAASSDPRKTAVAKALVVDASGNVIVTGESEGAFLTVKYDGDGNELWARRYRSGAGHVCGARAIFYAEDGYLYVAGDSVPAGGASDYLVVKYDAEGEVIRTFRYDGPAGKSDEVKCLLVDSKRKIYVAGRSQNENGVYRLTTVRIDPSGGATLVDRYAGKPGGLDEAEGIAIDRHRNVYVAGTSTGDNGTDYVVIKITDDGERAWVRTYDGASGGDDRAKSLALGPLGEVYVTGWSHDASMGALLTTLRYDNDGNLLWVSRYEQAPGALDRRAVVSVDPFGKIMVAGGVGPVGDAAAGFLTLKLDTDGRILWTKVLGAGAGSDSRPVAMALDASTNVLLTGTSERSGGSTDFLTAKYDQGPLWQSRTVSPYPARNPAVAVDGSGAPHVCYWEDPEGSGGLLRYATHEVEGWSKTVIEPHDVPECVVAVDTVEHPSVCYAYEGLKCATFDGNEWVETMVDAEGGVSLSATTDAKGKLHLSYVRPATGTADATLVYARYNGSKWIRQTIPNGTRAKLSTVRRTSLALSPAGKAHIAVSLGRKDLLWVTNGSGEWVTSPIGEGDEAAMVVDDEGYPHVAFTDQRHEIVWYARYDGSGWQVMDLVDALGAWEPGLLERPSISLDAGGVVHIVCSGWWWSDTHTVHVYKTKAGWAYDRVGRCGGEASMASRGSRFYVGGIDYTSQDSGILRLFNMSAR